MARIRFFARTAWGADYTNDYAVMVRSEDDLIIEVHEFFDGMAATQQLAPGAPESVQG